MVPNLLIGEGLCPPCLAAMNLALELSESLSFVCVHQEMGKDKRQQMARRLIDILNSCEAEVFQALYEALKRNEQCRIIDAFLRPQGRRRCIELNIFPETIVLLQVLEYSKRSVSGYDFHFRLSYPVIFSFVILCAVVLAWHVEDSHVAVTLVPADS